VVYHAADAYDTAASVISHILIPMRRRGQLLPRKSGLVTFFRFAGQTANVADCWTGRPH
jgi:hypothetical protein